MCIIVNLKSKRNNKNFHNSPHKYALNFYADRRKFHDAIEKTTSM